MFTIKLFKLYNRRLIRTISIMIVVVIVVFLILAPSIVTQVLSGQFYRKILKKVETHYQLMGQIDINRIDQLKNFVVNATTEDRHLYLLLGLDISLFYNGSVMEHIMAYTAYPTYTDALPLVAGSVSGRAPQDKQEVMVGFSQAGIDVGSEVGIGVPGGEGPIFNVTVVGTYEPKGIQYVNFSQFGYESGERSSGPQIFIHPDLFSKLLSYFNYSEITYRLVVVYGEDFFSNIDIQNMVNKLEESNKAVKSYVSGIASIELESNNLLMELMIYSFIRNFVNIGIYVNAIPFFVGIWYLLSVNIDLMVSDYRREIAILRARGIPSNRLFNALVMFIVLISGVAIAVGILSTPLWIPLVFATLDVPVSNGYFGFIDVNASVMAAVVVMVIVILTLWRKKHLFSEIAPAEAMHKFEESIENYGDRQISKATIAMFLLGTMKMVEWIFSINVFELVPTDGNVFLFIIIGLYSMVSGFLNIFAPLFFIYSLIQLITYSDRVVKTLSKLSAFFVNSRFRRVLVSYIARSPRWVSKGAFISSLMIALMIFSIVYSVRAVNFYSDYNKIRNSPDLIFPVYSDTINFDSLINDVGKSISTVDGVESWAVGVVIEVGRVYYNNKESFSRLRYVLVARDAEELMNVINLGESWNYYGDDDLVEALNHGLVISYEGYKELVDGFDYSMGDQLRLYLGPPIKIPGKEGVPIESEYFDIPVTGALYILPSRFDAITTLSALENLGYNLSSIKWKSFVLIVDVAEGYDLDKVSRSLVGSLGIVPLGQFGGRLATPMDFGEDFQIISSYSYHIYSVLGIVAALSTIFILTLQHIKVSFRDMVLLRARGVDSRDVIRFMYATSIYILLFSIVLGVVTGFVSGYGVSQMNIASLAGGSLFYPVLIDFSGVLAILVVVVLYLFTPIPVIYWYGRMNVGEVLRRVE